MQAINLITNFLKTYSLMKKFSLMVLAALFGLVANAQQPALRLTQNTPSKTQILDGVSVNNIHHLRMNNSLFKAPLKAAEDYVVITDQPEGELKTYARSGNQYYVSGQNLGYRAQSGTIDVVFGADNKVYFKDIVSGLALSTWVEGTMSEDGQTITVPLGQNLYYVSNYDACIAIQLLQYSSSGFAVVEDADAVTFTVDAEGVMSLQGTGFTDISLGATWTDDGSIQNYGDYESVYTPYTPNVTPVTLPEGVVAEDMPFESKYFASVGAAAEAVSGTVKVAKVDNTFYIQGLVADFPEAWIQGELTDGDVTFPITYLGANAEGENVYAVGYSSNGPAEMSMTYNAELNALELDGYMMLNTNELSFDNFDNLRGYYQTTYIGQRPATVEVPEGLETAEMPFTGSVYDGQAENATTGTVLVGIDGDDVYIQGLIAEIPEGWIKGTFNEDHSEVAFPAGQYVGVGEYGSIYIIGEGASEEESVSDAIFTYDSKKNYFELQNNLYVSGKKDQIYYYSMIVAGMIIGNNCDEIWIAAEQGYENSEAVTEFTIGDNITATAEKGEGTIDPKYYTTGEALRLYANNTLTITSKEKPMAKIVITMTGSEKQKKLTANVGEYALAGNVGTWTGEAKEVVFTIPSETGSQARIQKIEIYYFDYATTLCEAPEDLVTETYLFDGTDTYYDRQTTKNVEVGFKDSYVYFQGLSDFMPEAWVRGELVDGVVTIPDWFLGEYTSTFGSMNLTFSGATFTYDAEADKFYSEEGFQSLAESGYAMDEFAKVTILKVLEQEATPADPSIEFMKSAYGDYIVNLEIPIQDVDGNYMVSDKLSYVLYVEKDGEQSELEFTTDLYERIEENMTEIPYDYTDNWDITNTRIYMNQDETELQSWTKIGVQSIYRGLGVEHRSNIVWFDLAAFWEATGIATVNAVKADSNVIFDLQGRRVAEPAKGLYIVNGKKVVLK